MPYARIMALTSLAMMAFAGNSLLCRVALKQTSIDPASFSTIRPVEYWEHAPHTSPKEKDTLAVRHRQEGFAFNPHNWAPIDGDVTYGDSSMSLDWITATFPDWTIKATDRCLNDPLQRYVFLVPR